MSESKVHPCVLPLLFHAATVGSTFVTKEEIALRNTRTSIPPTAHNLEASWLLSQGNLKLRQVKKLTGVSVCTIWKQKWAGVWLRENKHICPSKLRWTEAKKIIGSLRLKTLRARL